jgi:hypothetical protein
MVGYEIPDLDHFIIFEEPVGNSLLAELHPASKQGPAVVNHPCLELWIGCMVSEQVKDGSYTTAPVKSGSSRGNMLFKGKIDWEFDAKPETVFRYTATIPGNSFASSQAAYLVIDYIIIVPDPRKISAREVDELMMQAVENSNMEQILSSLQQEQGRLDFYHLTNWNVERP